MSIDHNEITKTRVLELMAAVREHYNAWSNSSEETKKLRRVATAIFNQRHYRGDADQITMGIPGSEPCRAANNTVTICFPMQPAWATYLSEARAAIEACTDPADNVIGSAAFAELRKGGGY